ncbi:hypothetical protein BDV23DRAFT_147858 [Aspergillus alliaceus]|uniref:Uncharacterized protein n=1 Tax=Petromyces alliaceus TaxID=209559 RepID=A0A5N7CIN4_PETAA|nr:hypothetical protein BDV23DRAFT_147858 [Aspergillus alliaceus]
MILKALLDRSDLARFDILGHHSICVAFRPMAFQAADIGLFSDNRLRNEAREGKCEGISS